MSYSRENRYQTKGQPAPNCCRAFKQEIFSIKESTIFHCLSSMYLLGLMHPSSAEEAFNFFILP
eukprot:15153949-Ditylum_brightwellii.AAC.1